MSTTVKNTIKKLHGSFKARAKKFEEKGDPEIDFSDLAGLNPALKQILIVTLQMFAYGESAEKGLAEKYLVGKVDKFCSRLGLDAECAQMLKDILCWYAAEEARHGRLLKKALAALGAAEESKSILVTTLLVITSRLPLPYSSGFLAAAEIGAFLLYTTYAEFFPVNDKGYSSIRILAKLIAREEKLHIQLHKSISEMWNDVVTPSITNVLSMGLVYLGITGIVWKIGGELATTVSKQSGGNFASTMLALIYKPAKWNEDDELALDDIAA